MSSFMWIFVLTLGYSNSEEIELTIHSPTEIACNELRIDMMEELYENSTKFSYWYITPCKLHTRRNITL